MSCLQHARQIGTLMPLVSALQRKQSTRSNSMRFLQHVVPELERITKRQRSGRPWRCTRQGIASIFRARTRFWAPLYEWQDAALPQAQVTHGNALSRITRLDIAEGTSGYVTRGYLLPPGWTYIIVVHERRLRGGKASGPRSGRSQNDKTADFRARVAEILANKDVDFRIRISQIFKLATGINAPPSSGLRSPCMRQRPDGGKTP